MALTNKQLQFCKEYLIDLNATQAAIRAGYSKSTANRIGSENLSKLDIAEHIQRLFDERSKRTEITIDRVLKELAAISFFDPALMYDESGSMLEIPDMPEEARRCIAGVTVTATSNKNDDNIEYYTKNIKLIDKKGSLELIGKHLAMFIDRVKMEGVESPLVAFRDRIEKEVARLDAIGNKD